MSVPVPQERSDPCAAPTIATGWAMRERTRRATAYWSALMDRWYYHSPPNRGAAGYVSKGDARHGHREVRGATQQARDRSRHPRAPVLCLRRLAARDVQPDGGGHDDGEAERRGDRGSGHGTSLRSREGRGRPGRLLLIYEHRRCEEDPPGLRGQVLGHQGHAHSKVG